MMQGYDYSFSRPDINKLSGFVCRYLSYDPDKNITKAEAELLHAAGIAIVLIWETDADAALSGNALGKKHGTEANNQARALGCPDDIPIYFAADFDASEDDQKKINSYLRGVASVIGKKRTGLYGGYWTIKRAFDADVIDWGWQTYAWSGGKWDSRAQIQQYENDVSIGGESVDRNRSTVDNFGQWLLDTLKGSDIMANYKYISLTTEEPVTLEPGTPTRIRWDKVYANTSDMTVGKNSPGIINSTDDAALFILTANHIPDNVTSRLIEVDEKNYKVQKEYEYNDGSFMDMGEKTDDNHLYLECHCAVKVTFTPIVKTGFWI